MASARTQVSYLSPQASYLSPALSPAPPPRKGKLRREERDRGGNVLPSGSGTGYGVTNYQGVTSHGSSGAGQLGPRIRDTLAEAKERRRGKRQGDGISRRNMLVDGDGYAHDSEYVQFRTATPVHVHSQRSQNGGHNDEGDDSASSSSASSSEDSRFPSSPYTYQSTHRTTTSTHHHYATPLGTTASAVPGYLTAKPHRTSVDYGSTSLAVPRAPSPRRASADYERPGHGAKLNGGSSKRAASHNYPTTASYQPPAPAFSPRPMDYSTPLRLPTQAMSSDTQSLTESAARLSLGDAGGSGYNQYASTRPMRTEGTLVDAGVHGMKRSWDGFKLEMKFGAHKAGKKLSRKITNM